MMTAKEQHSRALEKKKITKIMYHIQNECIMSWFIFFFANLNQRQSVTVLCLQWYNNLTKKTNQFT